MNVEHKQLNVEHKQLLVAKCYELALMTSFTGIESALDASAMKYLDRIIETANSWEEMNKITRLEVIDQTGRAYVQYLERNESVRYSLQDDNRTLKVFIDK